MTLGELVLILLVLVGIGTGLCVLNRFTEPAVGVLVWLALTWSGWAVGDALGTSSAAIAGALVMALAIAPFVASAAMRRIREFMDS